MQMLASLEIVLDDINWYVVLASAGPALGLLAIPLNFVPGAKRKKIKFPRGVLSMVLWLAAGFGLGILLMRAYGYHWIPDKELQDIRRFQMQSSGMGGEDPEGGTGELGGGMMAGFSGFGQSPLPRLAALVKALDLLTRRPLQLELRQEQRQKLLAELNELADIEQRNQVISEDGARAKLKAIMDILPDDAETKEALRAVGYDWPNEGAGTADSRLLGRAEDPNKEGKERLQSLLKRLAQPAAK